MTSSGSMLLPVLDALHSGDFDGCTLAAGADPAHSTELPSLLRVTGQVLAFLPCVDRYAPYPPWWQILAGPAVVTAVAALTMAALPLWKQRAAHCVRLDRIPAGAEVAARVQELAAGRVTQVPRLFVVPGAATRSAAVFGTNGSPRLVLDGGLVASHATDPKTFDAVVLHELAHVANRDLTVTYGTVALWRTFIVVVIAPYLVWLGWERSLGIAGGHDRTPTSLIVRALALPAVTTAMMYFARADVLRSRELYADLTAHRWKAPLEHVWAAMPATVEHPRGPWSVTALLDRLRTHPRWEIRRDALDDPAPLFAVSAMLMFLTGVMAMLMGFDLSDYTSAHPAVLTGWLSEGIAAVPAAVATAATTATLWRATIRAAALGRRSPTGLRAGAWLGLGLIAGSLLSGQTTGDLWLPRRMWVLVLVLAAAVAFTCWTCQCARLATASWPGRTLRLPLALCLTVGWLLLAAWFGWWDNNAAQYAVGFWYDSAGMSQAIVHWFPGVGTVHPAAISVMAETVPALRIAAFRPLMPAATVAAWMTPLALWFAGTAGPGPGWLRPLGAAAGGGTTTDPTTARRWRVPGARRVTVSALIGGAVTVLGVAGVQVWLHTLHAGPGQRGGMYAFSYAIWSLWAITVGTAVAAATAAASARFRLLTALVAAGISALLGLAGTTVLISVDGCVQPLDVLNSSCAWRPAWQQLQPGNTFSLIAHSALLMAPVAAAVITAAAVLVRLARRAVRGSRTAPAPRPRVDLPRTETGDRLAGSAVLVVGVSVLAIVAVLTAGDARADLTPAGRTTAASEAAFQQTSGLPVLPASSQLRWQQVHAWYRLGGRYLLEHAINDADSMVTQLRSAMRNKQLYITPALMTGMRPVCQDIRNVASWEPSGYFQVPDPTAEKSWHQYGVTAGNGSQDCMRAVDEKDVKAFESSIIELLTARTNALDASNRVKAIINDPSDPVFNGRPTQPPQPL
ncbi:MULTISPECIES: M48 family metalloprotease [Streptacidiphilus]|uniref:M48 family metalloprotease n=1 Tax=Streptacidiphilus cavernicola TaxID=3342716 RepID=A0ABV6UXE3_9ACTN|nr:M48 family metalloprotease [Streptacidiphilus jeojiense]